jgi:hypothetical protein
MLNFMSDRKNPEQSTEREKIGVGNQHFTAFEVMLEKYMDDKKDSVYSLLT